ncbi:MAG: ribosomal protein S18-alanine N-acetyltransferase [Thermoleophilia bacterium]|nr:ribosomal protein S18-alanine N-acetyltransferase [Thermoleophilia bacterium]
MPNSGLNETAETPKPDSSLDRKAARQAIRTMTFADLPAVAALERRSFTSPWSPGMFVLEMSKSGSVSLAAEEAGRITGYIVLTRFDLAWHLMNVAVAPEHRRRGLATRLIESALARIAEGSPVTLEVRPSNVSAIGLYESLGFRSRGFRKGYYPDTGEDALIMWRGDPERAGVPAAALGNPAPGNH